MNWLTHVITLLAAAMLSTTAFAQNDAAQHVIRSLHWVDGPTVVNVGTNAKFQVPSGYTFLDAPDTRRFLEEVTHNSSNGNEYFFGPKDAGWWATFSYDATGHVSDDEKIDAAVLLKSKQENQAADNAARRSKGWPQLLNMNWKYPPFYEPGTKRLEWAVTFLSSDTNHWAVNYETRLLSREGVTSATLVVAPEGLDAALPAFKSAVSGYEFIAGQRYNEYKQGDRTAEYGLAALVAGGAAAVATKTGFWKTIAVFLAASWKLVAGAGVALLAGLGKLFKRKEPQ